MVSAVKVMRPGCVWFICELRQARRTSQISSWPSSVMLPTFTNPFWRKKSVWFSAPVRKLLDLFSKVATLRSRKMTSQSFPRPVLANAEERGPLCVPESLTECIWFKLHKVREPAHFLNAITKQLDDPVEAWLTASPLAKLPVSRLEHTGFCLNKREKLVPCLFLTERAQHGRRYCGRVLLFDPAHHHAQMPRFNHDPHA